MQDAWMFLQMTQLSCLILLTCRSIVQLDVHSATLAWNIGAHYPSCSHAASYTGSGPSHINQ